MFAKHGFLFAGALAWLWTAASCAQGGDIGPDSGTADLDAAQDPDADGSGTAALSYQRVQQKSSHNSYQRYEAILDQLIYHRVRSIEIDIHHSKGSAEVPEDWHVYHTYLVDEGTTCDKLSDCLDELSAFHAAVPDHEVVTVWIDLKDPWITAHQPENLDALLRGRLPPGSLLTPGDLMSACPDASSLQQAVTGACNWPSLASLRGKFLAVLTGGDVADPGSRLSIYLAGNGDPKSRAAFVAPDLTIATQIDDNDDVIFFNMNTAFLLLADAVFQAGFVGRVWGVNDASTWTQAATAMAHHIATDKVNYHQDPWAIIHDAQGWPFKCLDECPAPQREADAIIAIEADSGDIWDQTDSFMFLPRPELPAGAQAWTAFVATANSHVEEWAKGCLMARASLDADAAYFAVCRPADQHKLRVQYRLQAGASSTAVEADITPPGTIDPESVIFVRMDISADGLCATGYGSQDGKAWAVMHEQCFGAPLAVQGLAASSHTSGKVLFLFGNVTLDAESAIEPFATGDFGELVPVGAGATGQAFDGVVR